MELRLVLVLDYKHRLIEVTNHKFSINNLRTNVYKLKKKSSVFLCYSRTY